MKKGFLYFIIIFVSSSFGYYAAGERIKYLTEKNIQGLQQDFRMASPITKNSLEEISNKTWNCKLLGMRSRMDIGKHLDLYNLSSSLVDEDLQIQNRGAQMVKAYKPTKIGLYGKVGPYWDLIRINNKGQLISELSVGKQKAKKRDVKSVFYKRSKAVVSYAICNS